MKWIGQHIWDFISRFRSDVYLEATESGTIASGGNLGLDANNKIVKATEASGLSITNASDNRVVTSTGGTGLNAESGLSWDGDALLASSATAGKPIFTLANSHSNAVGPSILFQKTDTNGANDDQLGFINFFGHNDNNQDISFAKIHGKISDATDGEEAGKIEFEVAEYDGTLTRGLLIDGDTDVDGVINVTIGAGASSVTTTSGTLIATSGLSILGNAYLIFNNSFNTHYTRVNSQTIGTNRTVQFPDASGTIALTSDIVSDGWHGSTTRIKILPRDFTANDIGRPIMIEDDSVASNELFLFSYSSGDMFAYVPIPTGYKATHVRIYGSDTGQNFYVYEGDINTKTIADVATGSTSIGTEKTLGTEVTSDTTNYLIVRVTSDGATDEVHGGYVTIAAV